MEFKAVTQSAIVDTLAIADMLVIGVFDEDALTGIAKEYDDESSGVITKRITDGDFKPKLGNTFIEYNTGPSSKSRLLLVGLGKKDKFDRHNFRTASQAVASELKGRAFANVLVFLSQEEQTEYESELDSIREFVQALRTKEYFFDAYKSKPETPAAFPTLITIVVSDTVLYADDAINTAEAISLGMSFTKDLGNTPGNVCTPTWLGEQAKTLISDKVSVLVHGQLEIEAMKMGSFLAVAQGSSQEPKLIVVEYNGGAVGAAPIVLVGKGITFDTGGISLKPSSTMDEMKYDMMGAASVLGTIKAIAANNMPINVVAVVPTCENMPSHNAIKPGDIVTSMSGQTIEILNTDAEGRLILCDALTYAQQTFKPAMLIDVATLTGAIVAALGDVHSGLFTTDDALATRLIDAGYGAMDTVWRMPMDKEFDEMLKSNFADMANIGGRTGGASSAATFLARFTKDTPAWAHLDIAGTASQGGAAKGATGRPVPLLVQFLNNLVIWDKK
jgi:leucyl aminopeptidase